MKKTIFAFAFAALFAAGPASAGDGGACGSWRCGFNGDSLDGMSLAAISATSANVKGGSSTACGSWRCGFNGWSLNGTTLNGPVFNGVAFNGPVFKGVWLNGVDLNGRTLNGAKLNGVAEKAIQPVVACEGKACRPGVVAVTLPSGQRLAID
jgi:uncharacterized protein YjbI with pentapeptide repeats